MIENLTENEQRTFISNYGRAIIPQIIEYVKHQFGKEKTIWMSEYNLNTPQNDTISYSVLHTMFIFSYITAAICDETQTMELLMLHLLATQVGNEWGTYDFVTRLSAQADDFKSATFDINGQLLAQLGFYSLIKNNHMTCLEIQGTDCPNIGVNILGNNDLSCVYGVGFNSNLTDINHLDMFAIMLVNGCAEKINLDLDIKSFLNGREMSKSTKLQRYDYSYDMNGGYDKAKYSNCNNYENYNIWDESCAAVYANFQNMTIPKGSTSFNIDIGPLSVILALAEN